MNGSLRLITRSLASTARVATLESLPVTLLMGDVLGDLENGFAATVLVYY